MQVFCLRERLRLIAGLRMQTHCQTHKCTYTHQNGFRERICPANKASSAIRPLNTDEGSQSHKCKASISQKKQATEPPRFRLVWSQRKDSPRHMVRPDMGKGDSSCETWRLRGLRISIANLRAQAAQGRGSHGATCNKSSSLAPRSEV